VPLEALRIRKDDFLKLLSDYPDMMFEILRSLAQRLTRTTSELTEARAQIKTGT
jgi:CRP-like cAMP-binding protein